MFSQHMIIPVVEMSATGQMTLAGRHMSSQPRARPTAHMERKDRHSSPGNGGFSESGGKTMKALGLLTVLPSLGLSWLLGSLR